LDKQVHDPAPPLSLHKVLAPQGDGIQGVEGSFIIEAIKGHNRL
jgi:hypothetical protein